MANIRWERDLRKQVEAKIRAAAVQGVHDAAEGLRTDATNTIPHDSGTMQRSATVHDDPSNIESAVAYDTPYAVRQHEDTRLRHAPGRRAKWLQLTLQENGDRYQAFIADAIRRVT